MIAIAFRFPAGRYHATPWGHQVNEGLVEWPPCPWRLVRALIAAGYSRCGWLTVPSVAESLIGKLSSALPSYSLPKASMAHSRHYMPIAGGKTTLVLDTWLTVHGELVIHWPIELTEEEQELLTLLVTSLSYLGRSESWIVGRVINRESILSTPNCAPHKTGDAAAPGELVDLLAPMPESEYAIWRGQQIPEMPTGKLTARQKKDIEKAAAPYPENVLSSLQWDTAEWKGFGWSQPPGSRWIQYRRPVNNATSTRAIRVKRQRPVKVDVVLLALGTASGNHSALPDIARTLPQAELLHQSIVSCSDPEKQGIAPPVLTGHDHKHRPLSGHRHAHIIPIDIDEDGHLDHVLLWAPMGFDPDALSAIRRVRRTWAKGVKNDLFVGIAGYGNREQFQGHLDELEQIAGKGRVWTTLSPFVPPRFVKKKGANTIEGQILAELKSRNLPDVLDIEIKRIPDVGDVDDIHRTRFRHFLRRRSRGGCEPPQDMGVYVRLLFERPVRGPICLGYGSHFGLGLFASKEEEPVN